jgi:hypothetical protein
VDVLNLLTSLVDFSEVFLIVKAMDIVTPHLGRIESFLFMSKSKRILGLKLSIHCIG